MWKVATSFRSRLDSQSLRRAVTRLVLGLSKNNNAIPYSSVFPSSSGFSFPKEFSVSDYPGLLFCHILKGETNEKVIAYWRDEHHFRAFADVFKQRLALSDPELTGAATEVRRPREHIWKRYSLTAYILGAAALFGAFSAMRDYFAILFAAPDVTFSYSDTGRLDCVEGAQITLPFSVLSGVRFTPVRITFDSASIHARADGHSESLSLDSVTLPSLGAGQSATVKIYGTAPGHSKTQESPDVYDLFVSATAQAGMLRFQRPIAAPKRELRVWRNRPGTPQLRVSRAAGNVCELQGMIYASKPYPQGVTAEIVLVSMPDQITAMNAAAPGSTGMKQMVVENPKAKTRKMEFRTPAFDKFEQYRYKVLLELGKTATSQDCENWSKKVDMTLE